MVIVAVRVRHPARTLGMEYCCCCWEKEEEDLEEEGADDDFFRTWRRSSRARWDGILLDIFRFYFCEVQMVARQVAIEADCVGNACKQG